MSDVHCPFALHVWSCVLAWPWNSSTNLRQKAVFITFVFWSYSDSNLQTTYHNAREDMNVHLQHKALRVVGQG